MAVTQNVYHAAFAKIKGVKIGLVAPNINGGADIEVKMSSGQFQSLINEYNKGSNVDAKQFADEVGFIRYLAKNKK